MVVNMMKWRPWLATPTRCFQVKLKLHCLEGLSALLASKSSEPGTLSSSCKSSGELKTMMVNVKWKGPRGALGSRFKRSQKRAKTTARILEDGPLVTWEEEFDHTCILTLTKEGQFLPWDICFVVNQVNVKSKSTVLGMAWMNVARFVPGVENVKQTAKIHVLTSSGIKSPAILVVTADFVELRTSESTGFDHPMLSCIGGPMLCSVGEQLVETAAEEQQIAKSSPSKEGKDNVTFSKAELISDSSRDSVDSDSIFDWDDENGIDPQELYVNGYGPLTGVNLVVEGALLHCNESRQHAADDHVSSRSESPKAGERMVVSDPDQSGTVSPSVEPALTPSTSMRSILGWKKRKLKLRSSRWKGEPLLNKGYGEDGGDDIDFDRRLASVPVKTPVAEIQTDVVSSPTPECLDFGDEHFAVGSWERRDFISRDGRMKLEGDVFFATIDQRSERAAGESACTALVAVISAWLHQNPGQMPIKAELDTLIRDGSAEWRELCNRAAYKDLFPDGHFDFETVINAKIRPLTESPEKSYIGFFQLHGLEEGCDYLQGAMSFDSIWEEIFTKKKEEIHRAIYVVSWNDHFFILMVEEEVCYIIDTLGERLLEGGNQAYILRFDQETKLSHSLSVETEKEELANSSSSSLNEKSTREAKQIDVEDPVQAKVSENQGTKEGTDGSSSSCCVSDEIVYSGREACKEFIKGFFAALPLRELERDIKKGLHAHILHQRLQIEFHYTSLVDGPR